MVVSPGSLGFILNYWILDLLFVDAFEVRFIVRLQPFSFLVTLNAETIPMITKSNGFLLYF